MSKTRIKDVTIYYECEECGSTFDEDEIEIERYTDILGDWSYDYAIPVCPYCHSEDIKECCELEEIEIEDDGE